MIAAIENDDYDMVRILLEAGAKVNVDGTMPLHAAIAVGNEQIIEILISSGTNLEALGENMMTPLYCAVLYGHQRAVSRLIELGTNVNVNNKDGVPALHSAVSYGHCAVTKLLITGGADIEAVDEVVLNMLFASFHQIKSSPWSY